MSIENFISTVWSETLLEQLDQQYIGVKNCDRSYEANVKDQGVAININGIGKISVFDYSRNKDMTAPETLSEISNALIIDQVKAFNFQIDDVDHAQAAPKFMKAALRKAAASLANVADKYVYELYAEASPENTINVETLTPDNILDAIIKIRKLMLMKGINSNVETSLEVSPDVAEQILRAKLITETNNSDTMENGMLGKIIGFDVYVSPNIAKDSDGRHKCLARTKRAVAFVEQLNEIEAYRPESRFADAVKGLHLYGAKLLYPDEFAVLNITV